MKNIFLLIVVVLVVFWNYSCEKKRSLECKSIEDISKIIKDDLNADEVTIEYSVLQEELYFPKLRCIDVTINNSTTVALDFKTDNDDRCDYVEVEEKLKKEGLVYVQWLKKNCNLEYVDEIIFIYGKNNKEIKFIPWYTINYKVDDNNY